MATTATPPTTPTRRTSSVSSGGLSWPAAGGDRLREPGDGAVDGGRGPWPRSVLAQQKGGGDLNIRHAQQIRRDSSVSRFRPAPGRHEDGGVGRRRERHALGAFLGRWSDDYRERDTSDRW